MSIFEKEKDVIEKHKEGFEKVTGEKPEEDKKRVLVAKKKCKLCKGNGVITWSFPGNKGNKNKREILCGCVSEKEI